MEDRVSMKRFLPIMMIVAVFCGLAYMMLTSVKPPISSAQAMNEVVLPTSSPLPTDTPYPTSTALPTVDYRATDQAYTLLMEQERNRMIEIQLQHDENMMVQQVELARIGATQTYMPTMIALVNAENTLTAGQLTSVSIIATSTAEAPIHAAQLLQVATNAKNEKRDSIIYVSVAIATVIFLISVPMGVFRLAKAQEQKRDTEYQPSVLPDGLQPYIREDRGNGDFGQWMVPCTPEQMTEIWELVVNGERNFGINRIESTSRTLRRPTLVKLRKWLRENKFATELPAGEIALNDRAVAFIEKWGEDHELEEGYEFAPPPSSENVQKTTPPES